MPAHDAKNRTQLHSPPERQAARMGDDGKRRKKDVRPATEEREPKERKFRSDYNGPRVARP